MTRRWAILNGALALIVLALGVQIVRTWARTLPPVEARAPSKVAEGPARTGEGGKRGKRAQAEKSTQTPTALVTAIVNKDLFDPSRTKPSETTQVAQAPPHIVEPPPGISLVGVRMFGPDREGFILDATQANAQRRIRSGDTLGNFTVKSIRTNSVVLVSAAGDYVTLSLEVDKSKNPTGAVTPGRPGRPRPPAPPGASGSPAAGVMAGTSTAAGIGGPKPPQMPPGAPVPPSVVAGTPGAPPTPPATVPPRHGATPPTPNLPDGVRQKLEQMKGLNKR